VFERFSMEERMTVCNMAIEGGARCGYVNPDQTTYAYLKGRKYSPTGEAWDRAVQYWESIKSDADASYADVVRFDAADIEPVVTWGITPAQSVAVGDRVPDVGAFSADERETVDEAYRYMSLAPGQPIKGMKVDVAFIGSCTNGRLSDFEAVVKLLQGKNLKVKDGVRALVVPGSQRLREEMIQLGYDKVFTAAGFEFREAGCSMCLAMNPDKLVGREVCASSSNRNFKGRQGSSTGRTLLMSPAMVAAAAIRGEVADAREVFAIS
jgi:3-isopropylmalate/(R)-2-methylmalate dehydratase large subunit